jgi:hypothetical protein
VNPHVFQKNERKIKKKKTPKMFCIKKKGTTFGGSKQNENRKKESSLGKR